MSNIVNKADALLLATDNYCKARLELLSDSNPKAVTAHTRALDELRVARSEYAKAREVKPQQETDREWGRPLLPRMDVWVPAAGGLSGVGVDGRPYALPATVAPAATDAPSDTPRSGTGRTVEMRVLIAIDPDSGHCYHFSSGLSPERQLEQAKHALGDRVLVWLTGHVVLNDRSGVNEVKGNARPAELE